MAVIPGSSLNRPGDDVLCLIGDQLIGADEKVFTGECPIYNGGRLYL